MAEDISQHTEHVLSDSYEGRKAYGLKMSALNMSNRNYYPVGLCGAKTQHFDVRNCFHSMSAFY